MVFYFLIGSYYFVLENYFDNEFENEYLVVCFLLVEWYIYVYKNECMLNINYLVLIIKKNKNFIYDVVIFDWFFFF